MCISRFDRKVVTILTESVMEDNEHNYDTHNVILESSGGDSSHVVLTSIPPTKNNLRRRTNAGISQSGKKQQKTNQLTSRPPKRIPQWLWIIISKSLGIKSHPREKPYISSSLHLLTLGSAIRKLTIKNY